MTRTSFLAAIAVAALLMQFFPGQAGIIKWIAIATGVLYLVVRALGTYPRQYLDKKQRAAQQAADDEEYRQYQRELDSIRAEYDPRQEPADGVATPSAYEHRLSALHDRHKAMLKRKFGAGQPGDDVGNHGPLQ